MYIRGQANEFVNETSTIMWVLSYIKEGSAHEWRNNYLETVKYGKPKHSTLKSFFDMLEEEFGDPDKRSTKIYKLCTIMQGDHTADEHMQSFRKAARGSGYEGYADRSTSCHKL